MPIYEYQCDACGARRELILRPGETARPSCTACRRRMRRVISPTAFILKGSGWYVTDYPSESRKKGMEGEKPPAAAAPAGEKKESGAEAKKAAAPPAPAESKPPARAPAAEGAGKRARRKRG